MSTSDKIALAALIVSIAAVAFSFFSPWLHAWLFERPKLTVEAHFSQVSNARGSDRAINVTLANVGRRPLGIRHVGLILSQDSPSFVKASDNPLRYLGGQLGILARGQDDPLYLGENESRNLPPFVIDKDWLKQLGRIAYVAVEESSGKITTLNVPNGYYDDDHDNLM